MKQNSDTAGKNRISIFVGPMKAGTTWIYDYLLNRSELSLPMNVKETFFFDRHFDKGVDWYWSHFDSSNRPRFEVGPSYFPKVEVPERVYKIDQNANIIVTLRDPVKRAWSHYLHLRRYGYTTKSLRSACQEFPQVLEASRYNECVERWCVRFGADNVSVLWQEDMIDDLDGYTQRLCQIIAIAYEPVPESLRVRRNEAAVAPSAGVAAVGRRLSYALRDRRMYSVVNLAKKLGLKKFFFGSPGAKKLLVLSSEDEEWLRGQLAADYAQLPVKYRHSTIEL